MKTMYKEHKKLRNHPDLTRTEAAIKSVGAQLEPPSQEP